MNDKKGIITIIMVCALHLIANAQNTINVAEIIHINRLGAAETVLFYDTRNKILELQQWEVEKKPDTIYSIESWNHEYGTLLLMYWGRDRIVSALQDNLDYSFTILHQRAYTKRIIDLVEEWDIEKINNHHSSVMPSNKLYATRIILSESSSIIVDTICFPEILTEEDFDDAMELDEIWHPTRQNETETSIKINN